MSGSRPNVVFVPSDDAALAEHVRALVLEPDVAELLDRHDHAQLQKRLRERFPNGTVRPREELAQVRPDDPPVWYVSRGRERFRLHASVRIAVPREDVYRIYVDPDKIHLWQGVARIRPIHKSDQTVGNSWEAEYEILRIRLAGTFRIVKAEPPGSVRVEALGPLRSRLWYEVTFTEKEAGTLIQVEGDYELPLELLTRVPSRLFAEREIERVVSRSHVRLKELCETTFGKQRRAEPPRREAAGEADDVPRALGEPPSEALTAEAPSSAAG
jgi:uncharacterized protein YndB with AHSA1/START domain